MADLHRLNEILAAVSDLNAAKAVLSWDQETYMPPGGVGARAHQLATLGRQAHELFTCEEVGELLQALEEHSAEAPYDSTEASLARVVRRDYDRATKIPGELVAELERAGSLAQAAWKEARADSDFRTFQAPLERVLELTRRKAEALGYEDRIYDALLDDFEPGMKARQIEKIFAALRSELVEIVRAIGSHPVPDDAFLHLQYDEQAQWDFGVAVIRDFGFDFDRGRQDLSAHPFSTSFSIGDVRITTRVQEDYLPSCLFGTLHESGHALYEQGVAPDLDRTPLAGGTSLGIHESQSRLWENLIGRSLEFWAHYYPRLQEQFPGQLGEVGVERFYAGINKVEPSVIRVEADEVTYNLHIMLRFEIENSLLEGDLAVGDLPAAWDERMEEYLGLRPENDADGVLQDIHWSLGAFGYFPTYSLGNLIAAQLYEHMRSEISDLPEQVAAGQFGALLSWLRDGIHRYGRKLTTEELLQMTTGSGLQAESWLAYVRQKFGELYPGI